MAIYMEFEGIKGDTTAESHTDWITVHSAQFGVGRGISTPVGAADNREASTCSVSEFVVTKTMDIASGPIWAELVKNTDGKNITIEFVSTSGGATNKYMYFKMENALVSGMSFSTSGDRPTESVTLNFTKIESKFEKQDKTGTVASGGSGVTYDLALAKTV